jgi:uncharacterized protein (TIGR03083 family)
MDDDQFRPALHHEVLAYTEVLSRADLEAPVPSCPGWTVSRLTDHLGRVHRSVSQMMAEPTPEGGRWAKLPHAPEGPAVRAWFAEGAAQLEADLATFDAANAVDATADADETLIPTWAGRQPPRFWARRMAHETAVHRWDAESAGPAGSDAAPLDQALAADGIDEFFEVFTSLRLGADAIAALGPVTLRLVASDAERSWLVRADGTALSWTSPAGEAAAADLVLEAPAGTLLLLLWGRLDAAACLTSGDLDVAARWRTHIAF